MARLRNDDSLDHRSSEDLVWKIAEGDHDFVLRDDEGDNILSLLARKRHQHTLLGRFLWALVDRAPLPLTSLVSSDGQTLWHILIFLHQRVPACMLSTVNIPTLHEAELINTSDLLTGMSPIFGAIILYSKEGMDAIASKLVCCGANVNKEDWQNWTPLFYAAKLNNRPAVDFLLRCGATARHLDSTGKTAS